MLKDCIEIFIKSRSQYLKKNKDCNKITFITDEYPLNYGSYLLVDKKTKKIKKYLEVNKDSPKDNIYNTEIEKTIEGAKYYNIFTREEV